MTEDITVKSVQRKLKEMFLVFHNFCVDNQLTYIALGGTMLGAARHQGFIPWDDDIDVGMPRKDYEKLTILLTNKKIGSCILETSDSPDRNYCFAYAKLYDTTSTLIENTKQQLIRGVYIDIFPLDGLGNSVEEAKRNYKTIDNLMKLLITS
jgi:lipopolysaccharide cholinephosphotransferase